MIDDDLTSNGNGGGRGAIPNRVDGGKAVLATILAGAAGGGGAGAPATGSAVAGGGTAGMEGFVTPDSRHAPVGTAAIELPADSTGGTLTFVYLRRRFVPDPATLGTLRLHTVADGERLDHVAARELNDPLAFWKVCDANRIMNPLAGPGPIGRRLRIPLPPGVPRAPEVRS
jgi:hypothetical protein